MSRQEAEGGAGRSAGGPEERRAPDPQGRLLGVPYDLRRPTVARAKARWWNPDDPRIFTPKTFGWGYDVNLYWLAHPLQAARHGPAPDKEHGPAPDNEHER